MNSPQLARTPNAHGVEPRIRPFRFVVSLLLAMGGLASALVAPNAYAVPSFARQTGMACAACHTVFPELTPFGRQFKLSGYTLANLQQVQDISMNRASTLALNEIPPLSVMLQASVTSTSKTPAGQQNNTVEFPNQLSLFYAGAIADKLGAFAQITYSQGDDKFGMDNADVRYADNLSNDTGDFIWGVSVNNNPTVQDPWNSTPAWGYPYSGSDSAPAPAAATQLESLGQLVAGISAYAWWHNSIYGEFGIYRSAQLGSVPLTNASTGVIKGVSPYWRLAYQRQWGRNSWEVGTFGMYNDMYPNGVSGPTDKYTDVAVDTQYQYIGDENIFSVMGSYIHEDQALDASNPGTTDTLQTFKLTGNYYYKRRYGATASFFNTWGNSDANNPVWGGNANNSPDSRGLTLQASYLPWLNTKFAVQYTLYNRFDGTNTNASDNNTLFLVGWVNF